MNSVKQINESINILKILDSMKLAGFCIISFGTHSVTGI